jgi:hypothetical protein
VSVQGQAIVTDPLPPGVTDVIVVSKIGAATGTGAAGTATAAATNSGLSGTALTGIGVAAAAAGTLGGLYASGALTSDQPASRP